MKWNKKFEYPKSQRSIIHGHRHYDIESEKLPSVTSILGQTQSEEKRKKLAEWREREGKQQAQRILDQAGARGTAMHKVLEGYLLGQNHADFTELGEQAMMMAQQIIDNGIKGSLEEIWGSEVTLWYPELYAGATDVCGIYEGRESIIDFKQSNKPKRREWIEDYFTQLAAYAMAHNYIYQTKIQSGVILMCTKDGYFQKFVIQEEELRQYKYKWLERVVEY